MHLTSKNTHREHQNVDLSSKWKPKQAGIVILIADQVYFEPKLHKKNLKSFIIYEQVKQFIRKYTKLLVYMHQTLRAHNFIK